MSRSTLLAAGPDGDLRRVKDYSNSWWGAMAVWTFLVERYLQQELPTGKHWLGDKRFMEQLWRLVDRPAVPWIERVALGATFDRALVRGSERPALVGCFRAFMTLVRPDCHLGAMADDIEALPDDTRAIGWRWTSVAENLWRVPVGEDDERPYNIDRDDEHSWLFERVKQ